MFYQSIPSLPRPITLLTAGLLSASFGSLSAATTTFDTALPTTDVIYEINEPSEGGYQWRDSNAVNKRWVGFSFEAASAGTFDAFTMTIYNNGVEDQIGNGVYGADFTISVMSLADNTLGNAPTTPYVTGLLYSEQSSFPELRNDDQDFITFTFGTPFDLEEGGLYGVLLSFDTSNVANQYINLQSSNEGSGNPLEGVSYVSTDDGAAYSLIGGGNTRYNVTIQGTVPEPATTALLTGFGALVAVLIFRRTRKSRA